MISESKSFYVMISDKYWVNYIFFKHWSEVIVLVLELMISTAISNSRPPEPVVSASSKAREERRYELVNDGWIGRRMDGWI